jgi:hypothetical protein
MGIALLTRARHGEVAPYGVVLASLRRMPSKLGPSPQHLHLRPLQHIVDTSTHLCVVG